MNIRKKFSIIFIGGFALFFALTFLGHKFMSNIISNFTSGKMGGMGSLMGLSTVPVFQSGTFSDDGNYFAYTYRPEVEKPDVKGSIKIQGFAYPTYFRVMETATGKIVNKPYETDKYDQMYVVWTEDHWIWLMRSVYHKGNQIALYDIKANKFKYDFGELEKLNPSLNWEKTYAFYINNTTQKGLILEANDKRYYRIDPDSGKAEIIQGRQELVNYNFAKDFQVSGRTNDFMQRNINGNRNSIAGKSGSSVSQDDFIEVKYLTLTKNKQSFSNNEQPLTYYKDNFFVLSPVTSDSKKDMELTMIDKATLKTVWKTSLPQKELKTFIPNYESERFFIKDNQLFITNNDYLMTIDLDEETMVKQIGLYE